MILARTLAVLAAVMLVGAVAIAALGPPDLSLGQALQMADQVKLQATEAYVRLHLSAWLWDRPVRAVLERPVWLLPAAAGLLLAGGAMTLANNQKAPNSRRRRS